MPVRENDSPRNNHWYTDGRTTELYLKIPEKERLVASKEYFEMYGSLIDEEETSL